MDGTWQRLETCLDRYCEQPEVLMNTFYDDQLRFQDEVRSSLYSIRVHGSPDVFRGPSSGVAINLMGSPTIAEHSDLNEMKSPDLEKAVKEMVSNAFETAMKAMRDTLKELLIEGQGSVMNKLGAEVEGLESETGGTLTDMQSFPVPIDDKIDGSIDNPVLGSTGILTPLVGLDEGVKVNTHHQLAMFDKTISYKFHEYEYGKFYGIFCKKSKNILRTTEVFDEFPVEDKIACTVINWVSSLDDVRKGLVRRILARDEFGICGSGGGHGGGVVLSSLRYRKCQDLILSFVAVYIFGNTAIVVRKLFDDVQCLYFGLVDSSLMIVRFMEIRETDVDCVPRLETDLNAIKEQIDQLEQFLVESNRILQRLIESIECIILPDGPSVNQTAEKVQKFVGFNCEHEVVKAHWELEIVKEEFITKSNDLALAQGKEERKAILQAQFSQMRHLTLAPILTLQIGKVANKLDLPLRCKSRLYNMHQKRNKSFVETTMRLSPLDQGVGCSCSFLLKIVKVVILLGAEDSLRKDLIEKINLKLDEADVSVFLIPAHPTQDTTYDANLVQGPVHIIMMHKSNCQDSNIVARNEKNTYEFVLGHGPFMNVGCFARIPKVAQLLQDFFNGKALCKNLPHNKATGEDVEAMAQIFRRFHLEDKVSLWGLGIVMTPNMTQQKCKDRKDISSIWVSITGQELKESGQVMKNTQKGGVGGWKGHQINCGITLGSLWRVLGLSNAQLSEERVLNLLVHPCQLANS